MARRARARLERAGGKLQRLEHTVNPWVAGSIPARGATPFAQANTARACHAFALFPAPWSRLRGEVAHWLPSKHGRPRSALRSSVLAVRSVVGGRERRNVDRQPHRVVPRMVRMEIVPRQLRELTSAE